MLRGVSDVNPRSRSIGERANRADVQDNGGGSNFRASRDCDRRGGGG